MEIFKFILILFTIKSNFIWIKSCEITINDDLSRHNGPLLLHTDLEHGFFYPNSDVETIRIKPGETIVLACPGGQFSDNISPSDNVRIRCKQDNSFAIENTDHTASLKDLTCSRNPQTVIMKTLDKCSRDGVKGTIGFHVSTKSKHNYQPIIDFCHNEKIGHTLFAHTKIQSQIKNYQKGVARVEFRQDNFFKGISLRNVYRKIEQLKTIANIVGSMEIAEDFIRDKGDYFFAKGHLVAKADFIFGSQQLATFSYVNVVPMWQNVNGKNWARLEDNVRNFASDRNRDLEVWTGSLGILQIKDANRKLHDVYLHRSVDGKNSIPVPKLLFKVVYDSISKAGVAFVTINNPYLKSLDDEYVVCKDVCDDMAWFNYKSSWRRDNYESGYTYCCKVDDFRNVFSDLPKFQTKKLLV